MVDFHVESWIWYGVVMWIALSRFISRRLALGAFKALQADDYVMILALSFYTTLIATINIVSETNSNLLPPGYDTAHMTQQDINERTYGSKLILVVEECQCTVIWAAKACLLIMYLRFTVLAREHLAIKILAGYVAFGYILMEILYLGVWCRPFYEYWAVPTSNIQCDAATNHLITNAVLNLTSDVAMLVIGLPIFVRVRIPLRKKLPVILLFSLGIFVIVSAILNKIYSFTNPFGTEWVFWYVRESSTALIVANMPFVWTLYRRLLGLRPVAKEMMVQDEALSAIDHSARSSRRNYPFRHTQSLASPPDMSQSQRSLSIGLSEDRPMPATAAEMLRAEYLASSGMKNIETADINPYTHPALYYALQAKKKQEEQEAVEEEFGELDLGEGQHSSFAPSSERSTVASSRKPRSLGSFV